MKPVWIFVAAAALALSGCNRDQNSGAAAGGTQKGSMETPKGAATGQASEGSTDDKKAPQRPASK
jgi:hypothetical protein